MAVHPRNLLLFVLLAGAAFATWMLAREPEAPTETAAASGPVPEGYYMTGAVMQGTDEEGHIYYRLFAERLEQEADNDDLLLEGIRVQYSPETEVRWNIAASNGMAPASRDFFDLLGDVRLEFASRADEEPITFSTSELRFYPEAFRATSSGQIVMRRGRSDIVANGLKLDMNTDDFTLGLTDKQEEFNVRIRTTL